MIRSNKLLTVFGFCATALVLAFSPRDEVMAWVVTAAGAGAIIFWLGLERDERERYNMLRFFIIALVLRLGATFLLYKLDLISRSGLGGGDDLLWKNMWNRSRIWDQPWKEYPNSILGIFDGLKSRQNYGYSYLGGQFFAITEVRSQIALSAFNTLAGSVSVVLVYRTARAFWSEKGALFAGWLATLAPSFIFWSVMTQKEAWVILLTCCTVWAFSRFVTTWSPLHFLLTVGFAIMAAAFRFYVAPVMLVAIMLGVVMWRSKRPGVTLTASVCGLTVLAIMLLGLHIVHFDAAGFLQNQLEEARNVGNYLATTAAVKTQNGNFGTRSGVILPYDIKTPSGIAMTLLVGGLYVLFSPFPWQLSGRQFAVIPELLLYWGLGAFFVLPGIVHTWRTNRRVLYAVFLFLGPLILLYSIGFGNVFLTYRMRAQMLPFHFLLAAGGYEWYLLRRRNAQLAHDPQAQARQFALDRLRAALRGPSVVRQ